MKQGKRMTACLLAVLLALAPCGQAGALQAGFTETAAAVRSPAAFGQVDVSVVSALVLKKDVEFTVSLTGQNEKKTILPKDKGQQEPARADVTFDNLAPGTYSLDVKAPGFANYRQDIHVEDQAYGVKLMTGFAAGYTYAAGALHPGVILIGDADGDGDADASDQKKITDAVDAGSYDADADLNGDGKTDLADLEYFAKGFPESRDTVSAVETGIPAAMVETKLEEGQIQSGSIASLLKNEGRLQLSGADKTAPVSETNPVSVEFSLADGSSEVGGIVFETSADTLIETAQISVTDGDGVTQTVTADTALRLSKLQRSDVKVTRNASGAICVNLGTQTAVKKVTLRITGMKNRNNLAEIAKVTFLGDMADRIPEPAADIPENLSVEPADASFTLNWKACENVTGYEVCVSQAGEALKGQDEIIQVTGNTLTVSSLSGEKLENFKEYNVKVRSVNGTWRSGYSETKTVTPKPLKKPDAPDSLKAVGNYKSVQVSWKKMKDSESYNLYYKKKDADKYTKIEGITENSYNVSDLEELTTYLFYVTGVNALGEGSPSLTASADTKNNDLARVPQYKLLNLAENGEVSPHIVNAAAGSGGMQDSPKDAGARTAWGTVDNSPSSYYKLDSWDSGGFNPLRGNGLIYEFDQAYKIKMIALQELTAQDLSYGYAQIRYWDADGTEKFVNRDQISVQKKTDADGRVYYMLRLARPVTSKKMQIGLARSLASGTITVSEIYFYQYDQLEDDIMGLYTDDLHTVLRSDVTQETIDALRTRLNTKEPASGEYHPDRELFERELKTAEDILKSELHEPAHIYSTITTKDVNRGFGGLNAWQPLGVIAAAGDELTIYVGHQTKRTGENTNLQLVATQYHAESSAMSEVVKTLKIGRNDITVPKIWSTDDESGGALYVQYTGTGVNDDYAVRVSGGVQAPVLDLYQVTDKSERMARITDYVTKLEKYVSQMPDQHVQLHQNSANKNVRYAYNEKNCILGATDIMLDTMMLSLPAAQVLNGCRSSAQTLSESMYAIEDMMHLFYQHKGLNQNAAEEIDRIPKMHQNIRYQRMFAGAFMYASGNHIGIEYPETAGMASGKGIQSDASGKWESGQYFGWGIAHEIGHCINQNAYAAAEITNNYFSVLAQAKDTNDSVRFKYEDVYKKVTSNTKGRASNVFTQLGMYWQLHLAYDKGYNFKTYEAYQDQLDNLFFARVDTYARTPDRAPAPGGIKLTLPGDTDQNLMRLACAAAEKNILEFFERWGMTPDADTAAYANQFNKEERAICYISDDARAYQLTKNSESREAGVVHAVQQPSVNGNTVTMQLSAKNISAEDLLGYEIVRCTISGGVENRELAGFAVPEKGSLEAVFQDTVTVLNNRVVTYKVSAVNQYLYRGAETELQPVRIQHKGYLDKSDWTIRANDLTAVNVDQSDFDEENTELSCGAKEEAYLQRELQKAIDGKADTAYTAAAGSDAEIILEFHKSCAVTGFQYTVQSGNPITDYRISVMDQNGKWTDAADGSFSGIGENRVYFADKTAADNLAAYQTTAIKLAVTGQSGTEISITELDVCGIFGDDIAFSKTADNQPAIGRLENGFSNGTDAESVISNGALVFTGSYKGNAAYNVVILYDEDGNIIGGTDTDGALTAHQLVFSDVPEKGNIQDTLDGTWIYWIDPDMAEDTLKQLQGKRIRAELYRVDHAFDLTGQRMVSDTVFVEMPKADHMDQLPLIEITGGGNVQG